MATLEELTQEEGQQVSLEELSGGSVNQINVDLAGTNRLFAAKVATLSPEPERAVQVYDIVNSEMNDQNSSQTADALLEVYRNTSRNEAREALVDFLADPSIPDEQKQSAAEQINDLKNDQYNVNNTLKTSLLGAENDDLGHPENQEVEYSRGSFAEVIEADNEWRRQQQALINREAAKAGDNTTAQAFGEIFEHFVPFMESKDAADIMNSLKGGDKAAIAKAFTLLGNSKMEMRELIQKIPVADRGVFAEALIGLINDNVGSVIQDENDYARIDFIRTAIEDGYYTNTDRWIDNAISLLDMTAVGIIASRPIRAVHSIMKLRRTMNSTKELMTSTNPSKARAAHAAIDGDEGDEVAQALAGNRRDEVIADDLLPEIETGTGSVRNKVNDPDRLVRTAQQREVSAYTRQLGSSSLRPHEEAKIYSRVVTDFEQAQGVTARREMFRVQSEGDNFHIRAVYGPSNSGFSYHRGAVESVKRALAKYGIEDDQITLLRRNGDDYEPITMREADAESDLIDAMVAQRLEQDLGVVPSPDEMFQIGQRARMTVKSQPDYLVEVDFRYRGNPLDITEDASDALEGTTVKRNFFDRIGVGLSNSIGSLTRTLVDPASMFDPDKIVRPMYAGVERAAELERKLVTMARGYTDRMQAFSTDRKNLITEYLHEANRDGIPFNLNNLYAQGFSEDEVRAISSFREYWDQIWWLENRDMATTLQRQGWGLFSDPDTGTELVARAVQQGRLPNNVQVYNPRTDAMETLSKQQLDELYEQGGAVARVRSPWTEGDNTIEYVRANAGDSSGTIQRITPDSQVMQYRHGYYPTRYEDPIFIDRVEIDPRFPDRPRSTRAVATAGSIEDARDMAARLMRTEGGENVVFRQRADRSDARTADQIAEDDFNLADFGGFTAQRVRGERLRGATANPELRETAGILSPVDTMLQSARQVSTKVGMRRLIDTYSERITRQYGDYFPRNARTGEIEIPSDINKVRYRGVGEQTSENLGAARSHVEYLKYLENGYVNHIDDSYKAILRSIATVAGEAGNSRLEKTFRRMSQTRGPSAYFRGAAFTLYLVTNPVRQWVIQGHQAMQLLANFPTSTAKLSTQLPAMMSIAMTGTVPKAMLRGTGWTKDEAMLAYKQWVESGLGAGVDKQNIIRGSLTDLADRTASKGIPFVSKGLHNVRRVGYDAGENFNRMTAYLVHRDDAIRRGIDVTDSRNLEDLVGASSAYTYGMQRAGDMPYNQNFMSLLMQFMQVPHKAMLAQLTNRSLTPRQRLNLVGFNAAMFSLPAGAMYTIFNDILPAKETMIDVGFGEVNARDLLVSGLEGAILNKAVSLMVGEDSYIDYRGLAPNDQFGMFETLHSFFSGAPGEALAATPAGQIFWPNDTSRVGSMLKTISNYTNSKLGDPDSFGEPTEFADVVRTVAGLSSGFSNVFKARMALETRKAVAASGTIGDSDVTKGEAWAMMFGFGTQDEAFNYWITQDMYQHSQQLEDDVNEWYRLFRRHLARRDITVAEMEYESRVLGAYWTAFGNDNQQAKQIVDRLISRDLRQEDFGLWRRVLDMYGVADNDTLRGYIKGLPDEDAHSRKEFSEAIDRIEQIGND